MTIKAIIEMMDKLGFSNTAKHRVSYDLLESSMYIPVDREGSPLSKVLDMVNIEGIKIAEKLKKLTGNVWEIHVYPCGGNWYTVAYLGETLLGVSKYPVEAFPDNIRCVQYKEIVDYNSETYILE